MTEHIKTRKKLRDISKVTTFEGLLEQCVLSDMDKEILRMHYLKEKDFRFIADTLGYSEITVKERHRKALRKLGTLI